MPTKTHKEKAPVSVPEAPVKEEELSPEAWNSIVKEAKNRLSLSIGKLAAIMPLAYVPLAEIEKVPTRGIKTMGVGPYNRFEVALFFCPVFVMSLDRVALRGILQHEALHILLQHMTRAKSFGANHKIYNIAADLTINPRVIGIPSWGYFPNKVNLDDNEASEFYYSKLKQRRDEFIDKLKEQIGKLKGKGGGKSDDEISDDFFDSLEGSLLDDHSKWDEMSEEERAVIAEKIRDMSDRAIDAQNVVGWGNMPGGLADQILAANKPIVNWKRALRYFVNQVISYGRKTTRTRPNRRFGYLHSGTKRSHLSKVLVAMDVSGSVRDSELEVFSSEINGMIGKVVIDFVSFDTDVTEPKRFDRKKARIDIHGRGGTNFGPVISMADEKNYDGLIIMTDGEAPFPPPPKCRVLWVVCKRDHVVNPPYGKVIVLDQKD